MGLKDPQKLKEYGQAYRLKNKEMIAVKSKRYREKNKVAIAAVYKKRCIKNRVARAAMNKIWRQKNKAVIAAKGKIYREENKERIAAEFKVYSEKNRERLNAYAKAYREKNKKKILNNLKTNIQARLAHVLRSRLRQAIKNGQKTGSPVRDLGCTISELKFYLEGQFEDGMDWTNWTRVDLHEKAWNIDHQVSLSFFDLTDREQFLRACHYTNLKPMWWRENVVKGSKISDSLLKELVARVGARELKT